MKTLILALIISSFVNTCQDNNNHSQSQNQQENVISVPDNGSTLLLLFLSTISIVTVVSVVKYQRSKN